MSEQDLRPRQPGTTVANSSGNGAKPAADPVSAEESDRDSVPPAPGARLADKPAPRPTPPGAAGPRPPVDVASSPTPGKTDRSGVGARPRATSPAGQVGSSRGSAAPQDKGTPASRPAGPPPSGATRSGSSVQPGKSATARTATPPTSPPRPTGSDRAQRPLPPPPDRGGNRPQGAQSAVPPRPSLFKRPRPTSAGVDDPARRGRLAAAADAVRRAAAPPAPARPVRRARLRVTQLSPRTVFKITFIYSLCLFVVGMVAVAALWSVLKTAGVFDSVIEAAQNITDKQNGGIGPWLSFSRVMLVTLIAGFAQVILFTIFNTIGALLYNLCADVVGGVEVTFSDRN